uniref:Protein LEG1 homolog n=1 Tax=Amphiprion percula TaxID=161767 RepID=A0A3P8RJP2_AMPPE
MSGSNFACHVPECNLKVYINAASTPRTTSFAASTMQRPAVLGFLLACAASLCSSTIITKDGRPIGWDQTVETLTDLPSKDGTVTPNPWHFPDRMSLYRVLIAATDPFMASMGSNTTDSPVWGLPVMLAWEYVSGRLMDPTGTTTCGQESDKSCISPQSWWACESYHTSVLPFLSAAQQGVFGADVQVKMQKPASGEDYCTTYADCATRFPDAMTKWDTFYKDLRATSESDQPDNVKKDTILGLYWTARMSATSACSASQSKYSSEEVALFTAWIDGAEYYAACHHHTNLATAVNLTSPMPSRVLRTGDVAPNIEGLTPEENHTVSILNWMKGINTLFFGAPVRLWKSAMCSVSTREQGRNMMNELVLSPTFPKATFTSMVTELLATC